MERLARLVVDILAECTRAGMTPPFTPLIYGRDGSTRNFRIEKTEKVSEILAGRETEFQPPAELVVTDAAGIFRRIILTADWKLVWWQ
jgi:hypothetical protein